MVHFGNFIRKSRGVCKSRWSTNKVTILILVGFLLLLVQFTTVIVKFDNESNIDTRLVDRELSDPSLQASLRGNTKGRRIGKDLNKIGSKFGRQKGVGNGNACNNMEHTNLVYIKMIKCASTTITNLIKRYAHKHDLEVALPINDRIYIGWPYKAKQEHVLPPSNLKSYHIACDHVVYNREFFESIMYPSTIYITSLRYPYSQFKSMVNYYNVLNISGVPSFSSKIERFTHFVYNLTHYDSIYKLPNSSKLRYCIPNNFSMTKNLMSFNLGFPHLGGFDIKLKLYSPSLPSIPKEHSRTSIPDKYFKAMEKIERLAHKDEVDRWLDKLAKEMDLVLLVEWLPESLVLMRRVLCWSLKDVVVIGSNALKYEYRHLDRKTDEKLEEIYKSWSWIDYDLYDRFNKSLWEKINSQPSSFWSEVQRLKEIMTTAHQFCSLKRNDSVVIEGSEWNKAFQVDRNFCFSLDGSDLSKELINDYSERLKKRGIYTIPKAESIDDFC